MSDTTDYGARNVVDVFKNTLQSYLEAQYHIKNLSLIEERKLLLNEDGTISQLPYVEATPIYEKGSFYDQLDIPVPAKDILVKLSNLVPAVGIFKEPYIHQADALEAFFSKKQDLLIATGTGSGKTESFLMPILGNFAMEFSQRKKSAKRQGMRALLLYPMNALVNDQLSRIRRLFGDERVAMLFKEQGGRPVRFGSYTGRTPYPGRRSTKRDRRELEPIFKDFYLKYVDQEEDVRKLREIGKWPSKDINAFYGEDKITWSKYKTGQRAGQPRPNYNWAKRFLTLEDDRELLTRHEMQDFCPDILITNYSMLEYMLMRPIERSLFTSTKEWLASDENNEFIFVLDEAHMYRGTGGAEVALLIRRLQARLGIPRERMHCILTSASLELGDAGESKILKFASDLTGLNSQSSREFTLIMGEREHRPPPASGSKADGEILASFNLNDFLNHAQSHSKAREAVSLLAHSMGWPSIDEGDDLSQYLFDTLEGFGPIEQLIKLVSGNAIEFSELIGHLFPENHQEIQIRATETLLALCPFAKRASDQRVLMPIRLHLFYRGLAAIYACINPDCDCRRSDSPTEEGYLLGRLYTSPVTQCKCGARVYELLTHRDCGVAFLRGYIREENGGFLWHESSGHVGSDKTHPLTEVHLLVDGEPHPQVIEHSVIIWVDIKTGRLLRSSPTDTEGFLEVYISSSESESFEGHERITFPECPVCLRGWRGDRTKIMDLSTKGEAPFANLTKTQVIMQPPRSDELLKSPNGGRKSLLFSDGRQKAARLARDIPREVELDSFRQVLSLASTKLEEIGKEPKLNVVYPAFVWVCSKFNLAFFDGPDQKILIEHVSHFRNYYEADLEDAIENQWIVNPPNRYKEAIIRQICSRFYSLPASTIGSIEPTKFAFRALKREIKDSPISGILSEDDLCVISIAWINDLLNDFAFDREISHNQRNIAAGYPRNNWGSNGRFRAPVSKLLRERMSLPQEQVSTLQEILQNQLCDKVENAYFLKPDCLLIKIDLERWWYQCRICNTVSPVRLSNCCVNCGSDQTEELDPASSDYIKSRKGFWRNSVIDAVLEKKPIRHITAEEHTAQLSYRDSGNVYSTTEKYELRFQDVSMSDEEGPVDVLSCTTTMEVGVDIGSLVAVGLRNVPPQRENYQQRAGRSGRRGTSISTVVTYAQNGPHDNYYFHHPKEIVAGSPREPVINVDNEKIARRHLHSFLFQTFFHEALDNKEDLVEQNTAIIEKALGTKQQFFLGIEGQPALLERFSLFVEERVIQDTGDLLSSIIAWLPEGVSEDKKLWIQQTARELLTALGSAAQEIIQSREEEPEDPDEQEADELLPYLFNRSILPTYAFPTDLCSFLVEKKEQRDGRWRVLVEEQPQQSVTKALSEYAPGRLLVIDKTTYRVGGVTSSSAFPTEPDRAAALFLNVKYYNYCRQCSFVQDTSVDSVPLAECPICNGEISQSSMIFPEVFTPENGQSVDELDREQEFTYATSAQFPVPVGHEDIGNWQPVGENGEFTHAEDQTLVMVNKGKKGDDAGFDICTKCGLAYPHGVREITGRHRRPYLTEVPRGAHIPFECDGEINSNIFLGTTFNTDLLLLRITLNPPIGTDMLDSITRPVIEDGLRSLAEALLLAASLHLDIDPMEFSAGFRVFPGIEGESNIRADVYLFDTLSGGAGYADQAGKELEKIIEETLYLLENCEGNCSHSCQECLRHYANQYWHEKLDRHLAASFLHYMLDGTIPSTSDLKGQSQRLSSLQRMLELDGYTCYPMREHDGQLIPLVVEQKDWSFAIGTFNGILDKNSDAFDHPLHIFDDENGWGMDVLNEYFLDRNLPDAYQQIKDQLG